MPGHLVAFEGLDQSGKQTQAESLVDLLRVQGRSADLLSFPDYETPLGAEIGRALRGERDHAPEVMQLLYVANRYEHAARIRQRLQESAVVVCDRYMASSIAYGEAQGLDPVWLHDVQRHLPQPTLTLLLDIAPQISLERKQTSRDRFERDLALLARVRSSYLRQSQQSDWLAIDGAQPREQVAAFIRDALWPRLGLR